MPLIKTIKYRRSINKIIIPRVNKEYMGVFLLNIIKIVPQDSDQTKIKSQSPHCDKPEISDRLSLTALIS